MYARISIPILTKGDEIAHRKEIATREKAILWNGTGKYSFVLQMTQLSQQTTFQCVMTSRVHLKSDSLDTSISSYHRNKHDRKENIVFKGGVYLISSNGKFVPRSLRYRGWPFLESRDRPIFWLLLWHKDPELHQIRDECVKDQQPPVEDDPESSGFSRLFNEVTFP